MVAKEAPQARDGHHTDPRMPAFCGNREADLEKLFELLDRDNSGALDANELRRLSEADGMQTTELQAAVFEKADENQDGKINAAEFIKYNMEICKGMSDKDFVSKVTSWIEVSSGCSAVLRCSYRCHLSGDHSRDCHIKGP